MSDLLAMNKMVKENKDIRCFPTTGNLKRANTGKDGWGEVVIAVNNQTVNDILNDKLIGALYVMDSKEFAKAREDKK